MHVGHSHKKTSKIPTAALKTALSLCVDCGRCQHLSNVQGKAVSSAGAEALEVQSEKRQPVALMTRLRRRYYHT